MPSIGHVGDFSTDKMSSLKFLHKTKLPLFVPYNIKPMNQMTLNYCYAHVLSDIDLISKINTNLLALHMEKCDIKDNIS